MLLTYKLCTSSTHCDYIINIVITTTKTNKLLVSKVYGGQQLERGK